MNLPTAVHIIFPCLLFFLPRHYFRQTTNLQKVKVTASELTYLQSVNILQNYVNP